ncbi:hypothetical protein AYR55_03760 [Loigolactobacillus backii]|uniref:hypothetical protein n=1 Tax=Loigolactobacillus backii TaxID=375175 RepID=UPI0007F0DCCB|nr:hypothetical protein [Loigolactobacillus backii]ANK66898.1 hypothetical protein AYR55_03760 [Loigolactobacillus backii]
MYLVEIQNGYLSKPRQFIFGETKLPITTNETKIMRFNSSDSAEIWANIFKRLGAKVVTDKNVALTKNYSHKSVAQGDYADD